MDPGSIATAKAALKAGGAGLSAIVESMGAGPSRFAMFIQAFAPAGVVSWFEGHRLRIRQIKAQEQMFDEACKAMVIGTRKQFERYASSPSRLQNPMVRRAINDLQGDMRLLSTIREAVSRCSANALDVLPEVDRSTAKASTASEEKLKPEQDTDTSWWDTFEALARRRNEPWRQELLAKALVENDRAPGSLSLKAVWEIGMMRADDFGCLSAFCDSALHIDGSPVVLIEPEQQAKFRFDAQDGIREVNLAHAISALINAGLVSQAATQFSTKDPVKLEHLSGPTWFVQKHVDRSVEADHHIQINGFFANDVALDICRLYEPKLNIASNASFEEFRVLLKSVAKELPEVMGKIRFIKRKPQ